MTRVVLVMLLALACACSVFAADDGSAALREEGRALFHGERAFERPGSVAGVALPADAAPCARCHGVSGEGAREGGVAVPALQGARAAADTARWLGAAAQGHGRDGRALQAAMPRYDWSERERDALAAFVATLGTDAEPVRGVTPRTLTLGTLLPLSGPRAALGQAVLQGLRSHFDDINRAGGLYGRRIELLPIDWQGGDADLRAAVQGQGVLALVGSFVGDLTPAQSQELQALRLPMIGNLGPAMRQSQTSAAPDWASALWPSVGAQLQASAAEFETRCPANGAALHVLHAPLPGLAPAIEAALPGRALRVSDELPPRGAAPRRVLALLNGARVQTLRASLDARDCLWTLAMFSGAAATTGRATELVTLPGQAALPMADGRANELWPSLGRLSAQLASEALSRAGRGVQPEHLVRALVALPAFEPAPGVRLELSRQRRHALPVLTTWNPP